ncbi:hypothetical protein AJ88_23675 [Mesorhizobium amorphae CCBAU 01583]|nr:hypothetical protein AJ88_23675 [Mesorhizobium amorphae CCBAU 01583]
MRRISKQPGIVRPCRPTTKVADPRFRRRLQFCAPVRGPWAPPSAETAAMLFWALMASGQISMRKIDGWQTLPTKPLDQQIDLAA